MKPTAATKTDLARLYNVHYDTFKKWLEKIPDLELDACQRVLTPKQVQKIFAHLGEP